MCIGRILLVYTRIINASNYLVVLDPRLVQSENTQKRAVGKYRLNTSMLGKRSHAQNTWGLMDQVSGITRRRTRRDMSESDKYSEWVSRMLSVACATFYMSFILLTFDVFVRCILCLYSILVRVSCTSCTGIHLGACIELTSTTHVLQLTLIDICEIKISQSLVPTQR